MLRRRQEVGRIGWLLEFETVYCNAGLIRMSLIKIDRLVK